MKSITFKPVSKSAFQDSTMSSVLGEISIHQLEFVVLEHHKLSEVQYLQVKSNLEKGKSITITK